MTEPEWLTCAEPGRMLAYLEGPGAGPGASERKRRLYVEACREIANPKATAWTYDLDDPSHLQLAVEEWTLSADSRLSWALRAGLLRDLFGNPFRYVRLPRQWAPSPDVFPPHWSPHAVCPWLEWQNSIIPRMAQQIYDTRDFAALPVLADALEDAGCQEETILRHCREPLHVRGCWCLDLLLGKS